MTIIGPGDGISHEKGQGEPSGYADQYSGCCGAGDGKLQENAQEDPSSLTTQHDEPCINVQKSTVSGDDGTAASASDGDSQDVV